MNTLQFYRGAHAGSGHPDKGCLRDHEAHRQESGGCARGGSAGGGDDSHHPADSSHIRVVATTHGGWVARHFNKSKRGAYADTACGSGDRLYIKIDPRMNIEVTTGVSVFYGSTQKGMSIDARNLVAGAPFMVTA